jgi:hypothetical protein
MPIKWIVFKGPSQSGRSTAAHWLAKSIKAVYPRGCGVPDIIVDSLDAPMKHFVATAFGEKFRDMDLLRMCPELSGYSIVSWIEALRDVSEKHFGDDIFARLLMHRNLRMKASMPDYVIVDDGRVGRDSEVSMKPRIVCIQRDAKRVFTSETWYADADTFICNTGSIEDLYEQVRLYAERVVGEDTKVV